MKNLFLAIAMCCVVSVFGQTDADTEIEDFSDGLIHNACECMDSISVSRKSTEIILEEISRCIDRQVTAYQLREKIMPIGIAQHNDTIVINNNPQSAEYRRYYNEIEKKLFDKCSTMRNLTGTTNKESDVSFSENPQALFEYKEGVKAANRQDFKQALTHFEKAVGIDEKFAFAWDNIGMCYRQLGKYKKAIESYRKSLSIDTDGEMPLINLPVVYRLNKQNDQALEAYFDLQKRYPHNPEGYYGAGQMLYLMEKHEEALNQVCMAYWYYVKQKSPYRSDAEQMISTIYQQMKTQGKKAEFNAVMKKNNINVNVE